MSSAHRFSQDRKSPSSQRFGKFFAFLLAALIVSLLFGSQSVRAADGEVFIWNLVRKTDGGVVCTIAVTHDGKPVVDEISQQCSSSLAADFQKGEYILVNVPATPTPTAITYTPTFTPTSTPVPIKRFWMDTPAKAEELRTNRPLGYLAGKLIAVGYVSAAGCNGTAFLENGYASACGLQAARAYTFAWQNRFDATILQSAKAEGVPAFLFKNQLIRESQMWPQASNHVPPEYGIGQLTENGADTLLMWNLNYFKKICRESLPQEKCNADYLGRNITQSDRAYLRGMVVSKVRAECEGCPLKLDMALTEKSIPIFAATVKANYNQVNQVIKSMTGRFASSQMESQEIWKLAVANYNGGSGCISAAMRDTLADKEPLRWKYIKTHYRAGCKNAIAYVESIILDSGGEDFPPAEDADAALRAILYSTPMPTPTLLIVTPTVSQTVTVTGTLPTPTITGTLPTATITVTATPTLNGSETPTVESTTTSTLTVTPSPTTTVTPIAQPTSFAPPSDADNTGEIVVKFGGLVPQFMADSVVDSAGGEVQTQVDTLGLTIVSAPAGKADEVLAYLQDSMLVDYAEPNYMVQAFYTPNDPDYINQTYLTDMQIPAAWDIAKGDGVIVAVIDTGVDVTHPDLANNIYVNPGEDGLDANGYDKRSNTLDDDADGYVDNWMGWNFVDNNNDARDGNGHGTHSAGIIAAQMDNTLGVAGIAPNAKIMTIKALDDGGLGSYSQVAQAIIYAVDHGAQIVNLGFGGTANSEILLAATNYAYDHNVIVVAAAGNTGAASTIYPAANPNVIAVSALNPDQTVAPFSTVGNASNISAPGVGIYSTALGGSYSTMSGTSMSAAEISGVAALLRSQAQFDTPDKVRAALFSTALDLGDPAADLIFGAGMVHAFDALYSIPGIYPTPTPNGLLITPTPGGPGGVSIMAVAPGTAWTNINATSPNNQNATVTSTGTFTAGVGKNRILLVGIICEINTGAQAMTTLSATYGGVALTELTTTRASTNREHVWVGYLLDSQIPAGAQNVQVTYNTGSGANTLGALDIKAATYIGVDQVMPFVTNGGWNANIAAGLTVANSAAINYVANGLTFYVAGNGGTPATNGNPAGFTTRNSNTSGTQTSIAGDLTTPPHGANGTYAINALSFTFGGTTSAWSALVVGTLNPAQPSAAGAVWTNINATTPNNQSGTVTSTGTFTAAAGTNRILLVGIICEINTGAQAMTTLSATYGGVALTQLATTRTLANQEHVWVGYILDSQIPAGAQSVQVTYNTGSATNTLGSLHIKAATYTGVDQKTPFNGSNANIAAGTTVATNAAINYVVNGATFYVAGNGGAAATNTITASPTISEVVAARTQSTQTSFAGASATHTTSGTYASGGISVAFAGTTSNWSALVVGTLNPPTATTLLWGQNFATCTVDGTATTLSGASVDKDMAGDGSVCVGYNRNDTWDYTDIEDTTLAAPLTVNLSLNVRAGAAATQSLRIDVYDGTTWTTGVGTITLNGANWVSTPAGGISISGILNTTKKLNAAQVRLFLLVNATFDLYVDEVSLAVTGAPNFAPVANRDTYTTTRNTTLVVPVTGSPYNGVLYNDTDADANPLTARLAATPPPTIGTISVFNSNGSFTFVPAAGYTGKARFTYYADDGTVESASPALVIINVVEPPSPPTVNITAPTTNSSYSKGASITFTVTASETIEGPAIANKVVWFSDIDGLFGEGNNFAMNHLTPGTHSITARVTDMQGETTISNAIIVTITSGIGMHGKFNGSTEACALCHRPHSALSSGGDLLNNSNSAYVDNTFCLSCHNSGSVAVSTHSNAGITGGQESTTFELLCVQCHDPHGGTGNLFAVRQNVYVGAMPTLLTSMTTISTSAVFTSLTGANSFDDGGSNEVCTACHTNASNPGSPIKSHSGGAGHGDSQSYVGTSCIKCHPHNTDSSSSTKDGFMPFRCVDCHAAPQDNGVGPVGGVRRITGTSSGDFYTRASGGSHHVAGNSMVRDSDCLVCHDQTNHTQGIVLLKNVDTGAALAMNKSNMTTYALNYETFCLKCHDADGKGGDTTPFSDNIPVNTSALVVTTASWTAASHNTPVGSTYGSCYDCHSNGHGSNRVSLLGEPVPSYTATSDDPTKEEEGFCFQCHNGSGPASATNVAGLYSPATRWVNYITGSSTTTPYLLNDRHDVVLTDQLRSGATLECINCHNPHSDSSANPVVADPDPNDGRVPATSTYVTGANLQSKWCLDCHDNSFPSGVSRLTSLTDILTTAGTDAHGVAVGNPGLKSSATYGYTAGMFVQCMDCHVAHRSPTNGNLVHLTDIVMSASGFTPVNPVPSDGGAGYNFTDNLGTPATNGYNWCNTCHTSSMGSSRPECFTCHFHGSRW